MRDREWGAAVLVSKRVQPGYTFTTNTRVGKFLGINEMYHWKKNPIKNEIPTILIYCLKKKKKRLIWVKRKQLGGLKSQSLFLTPDFWDFTQRRPTAAILANNKRKRHCDDVSGGGRGLNSRSSIKEPPQRRRSRPPAGFNRGAGWRSRTRMKDFHSWQVELKEALFGRRRRKSEIPNMCSLGPTGSQTRRVPPMFVLTRFIDGDFKHTFLKRAARTACRQLWGHLSDGRTQEHAWLSSERNCFFFFFPSMLSCFLWGPSWLCLQLKTVWSVTLELKR